MDKLSPRAHIGWLVGFDSTNIFRIYVLKLNRVISTRDVTFDETLKYDPKIGDDTQATAALIKDIEIQDVPELNKAQNSDDKEETIPRGVDLRFEKSIDAPGDTVVVQGGLPTHESTPEPDQVFGHEYIEDILSKSPEEDSANREHRFPPSANEQPGADADAKADADADAGPSDSIYSTRSNSSDISAGPTQSSSKAPLKPKEPAKKAPTRLIPDSVISEDNILTSKRHRQPKKAFYAITLLTLPQLSAF